MSLKDNKFALMTAIGAAAFGAIFIGLKSNNTIQAVPQANVTAASSKMPAREPAAAKAFADNLPPELEKAMLEAQKRKEDALASEEAAKDELKHLRDCVLSTNRAAPQIPEEMKAKIPSAVKSKIAEMGWVAQAECVREAEQLAAKYPALKAEARSEVVAKANPKAVEIARRKY